MTNTYSVTCPAVCCNGKCDGEMVTLNYGDFSTTTVSIEPCSVLLAQGWDGPQVVDYKSRADRYFPEVAGPLMHRDGLVTFN